MLLVAGTIQARSVDTIGSRLFDIDVLLADRAAARNFGNMPVPITAILADVAYGAVIMPAQLAPEVTLDAEEVHAAD